MNLAALALAPAALAGLAAAWFLLDWMRAASAALPGLQPAGPAALPWLLLCAAAGSVAAGLSVPHAAPHAVPRTTTRAARSPLAGTMRWLAASAAAVIAAAWGLSALLPSAGETVLDGWPRLALAVVPAAPAAFLIGGAFVRLAAARVAHGASPVAALCGASAAAAAAAGAGVLLYPGQLLDGTSFVLASSACLLAGALACAALSLFEPSGSAASPASAAPSEARGSNAGPTAGETSASTGAMAVLMPLAAAVLAAAAAPGLLRAALQRFGSDLDTTVAVLASLAGGACLGACLAALPVWPARLRPLGAWLLLAPVLALVLFDSVAPFVPAGLLGLGLGAALAWPVSSSRAGARAPAWALIGAAAGLALGVFVESRLRHAGWSSGELLRATALSAAGVSLACALGRGAWLLRGVAVLPGALLLIAVWSRPAPALPWRAAPDEVALLGQWEDPLGTLTLVGTSDGGSRRKLDGWTLPSGTPGVLAARRMARLSAAMQPQAQAALVIGAGDGQLLAGLGELLPGRVECLEPLGSLVAQARATPLPDEALAVPALADPRAAVAGRAAAWDLVIIGPQPPGRLGQGDSLALQHLLALRRAVRPGGVVVQWLPLSQMPWPAFASASQAFLQAFPETRVFVEALDAPEPLVALVGGLEHGLPGVAALDALLGAEPSVAGLAGAADVFDLYVCDGWVLGGKIREAPVTTLERPVAELLSAHRERDAVPLAIMNLRLLADLATPLDTVSLAARPVNEKEDKELGAQLVARSRALRWLLVGLAARLERVGAPAGALSADERSALEDEQAAALLSAWSAAPGHVDALEALLGFAAELVSARRWALADSLLASATSVLPDGRLLGLRAGVLIELGAVDEAVRVGREATSAAPHDPNALVNFARALLITAQDDEARAVLVAAREAFAPTPLPPLHAACLALLEQRPDARAGASALLERIPAGESWAAVLRRLLGS